MERQRWVDRKPFCREVLAMTRTSDAYADPCSGSRPSDPNAPHPATRGPSHAVPPPAPSVKPVLPSAGGYSAMPVVRRKRFVLVTAPRLA